MKTYPMPAQFDGGKFATRYNLNALRGDFRTEGETLLVPDSLPDDPPVFDAPDTPEVRQQNVLLKLVDQALPQSQVQLAIMMVLFDELNAHALRINQILDAIDGANSLPDLKTRIALVADYPARNKGQAIAALKSKINSGNVG